MKGRLITPRLAERFKDYPLYSQEGKGKEAVCVCVFFIGHIRWYVLEGQKVHDDFTLFAIVAGLQETEYGYVSVHEMESIEVKRNGIIFRITELPGYVPCPLKDIRDKELQDFFSGLYDTNKKI